MKKSLSSFALLAVLFSTSLITGCLPYIYHEREQVLIQGIDIDQSLDIAEQELEDGGFGSVLTIWALRDQIVTPEQAARISRLYFRYIPTVVRDRGSFFNTWHLTWAISNLYRLGDEDVRAALSNAYFDASLRVSELDSNVATLHFSAQEIHMGDAHAGGRAYAESHLVVPGNPEYLQNAEEFEP